ncbi:hypothetical protein BV22DRAFT_323240 [Leucogyrophana mollusca]|uniref:Uncharacterized protein n=1 Tax=Leucogyrophana mollusca TaxID=85980 RepID=A0ACB8BM50_9AGAM|nr:hypothetical protein BV22DRAFT_323240 [Leucogyrophana mollusca]
MRLLNATTLKLEESQSKARNTILSYVWGDEEVSFRKTSEPHAVNLKGHSKIEYWCAQALEDGLEYDGTHRPCIEFACSCTSYNIPI